MCLVSLVVGMFDCRSRGPGFDSRVGPVNLVFGFYIKNFLVGTRSIEIGGMSRAWESMYMISLRQRRSCHSIVYDRTTALSHYNEKEE